MQDQSKSSKLHKKFQTFGEENQKRILFHSNINRQLIPTNQNLEQYKPEKAKNQVKSQQQSSDPPRNILRKKEESIILDDPSLYINTSFKDINQMETTRNQTLTNQPLLTPLKQKTYQQAHSKIIQTNEDSFGYREDDSVRTNRQGDSVRTDREDNSIMSYVQAKTQSKGESDSNNLSRNSGSSYSAKSFSYQTQNNKSAVNNANSKVIEELISELDISRIQDEKKSLIEKQNAHVYEKALNYLGLQISKQNIEKSQMSEKSLKSPLQHLGEVFSQNQLKLFSMNLTDQKIDENLIEELKSLDTFLLTRINVGPMIPFQVLKDIFSTNLVSLREIRIERQWNQKKKKKKEHGLQFITNKAILNGLKKIQWKTSELTKLFIDSLKNLQLPSIKEIKLELTQNINDTEEFCQQLQQIFNFNKKLQIHLSSSISEEQQLEQLDERLLKRLHLYPKPTKNKEEKTVKKEKKQSESKNNQREGGITINNYGNKVKVKEKSGVVNFGHIETYNGR